MEIQPNEAKTSERLLWHKPEVQLLVISLDTGQEKAGSVADGAFGAGEPVG